MLVKLFPPHKTIHSSANESTRGGNEMTDLNRRSALAIAVGAASAATVKPAASQPRPNSIPIAPFNHPKLTQEELQGPYYSAAPHPPGSNTLKDSPALPAVRSSAEYAAHPNNPPLPGSGTNFDRTGKDGNAALKRAILEAFKAHKPSDDSGAHFLIAWRHYPNKDHPRWKNPEQACGCGCGCTCGK